MEIGNNKLGGAKYAERSWNVLCFQHDQTSGSSYYSRLLENRNLKLEFRKWKFEGRGLRIHAEEPEASQESRTKPECPLFSARSAKWFKSYSRLLEKTEIGKWKLEIGRSKKGNRELKVETRLPRPRLREALFLPMIQWFDESMEKSTWTDGPRA